MDGKQKFEIVPVLTSVVRMEGITLAQAFFLCDVLSLAKQGRPYWKSRKEIGALLKLKERAVTKMIADLVELGYITRHVMNEDGGRRWYITLTPQFFEANGIENIAPTGTTVPEVLAPPCQTHWHHNASTTGTTVPEVLAPPCQYGEDNRELHRDSQEREPRAREGTGNTSCRDNIDEEAFAAQSVPQDILDSAVQLIGGTIAGPVYSQIAECVGTYGEKWVRRALQIARERDGRSIRYVVGILRSWKRNGYDGDARNATARRRAEAEEKRKAEADYYNRIADENLRKAMERWEREEHGQKNDGTAGKHQAKRDDWGGDGGGDAEVPLQAVPRTRLHLYQA